MKSLIKSATIIDRNSKNHLKKRDILIENGEIIKIAANITASKVKIISGKNLVVTPGFVDLKANFCDPGYEERETIVSGLKAAEKGGFKFVVTSPMTQPKVDSKSQIEYILSKSKGHVTQILPAGCLSKNGEGKQMSEMFDMKSSGAVAFTDDGENISTELLTRSLEYSKNFQGLIITLPLDKGVNPGGMVNEGSASVHMGLKGLSHISEEIRIKRDLDLLKYTGGKLHFSLISTAAAVQHIRTAKKDGLNVTCSIAAHQLSFLDHDMLSFESNLKVMPPFRTEPDKKEIIKGLKDGTIDAVCSDHQPFDIEHKQLEFEYASFGISNIQHAFAVFNSTVNSNLSQEEILSKFTTGPASVIGISEYGLFEGSRSGATVVSFDENTEINKKEWESKSMNSPFLGTTLKGKVIATF